MKIKYALCLLVLITSLYQTCLAQEKILYKQIDSTDLFLQVFYPEQVEETEQYPALVFIFGGGWIKGSRHHFFNQAKYFSERGLVCFLVDYRIENKHKTTPFESLMDAKSAMRYIRGHASTFHIDPNKIIASGGSAGGHLAAATALIEGYNEDGDDLSIDCKPNALVLFNPVIDNGPGGYGYGRIGEEYKDYSPLHNIKKGAPPTMILLGTNDVLIPVVTAQYYKNVMEVVGSRCDLKLYEGAAHGFYNYKNFETYSIALKDADQFLVSLGYIKE